LQNWQKEFKKWLGTERVRVFAAGSKSIITDFTLGKIYPVMVIGYEKVWSRESREDIGTGI
jgi:DNA repair and recombination protein RAD54B